MPIPDYKGASIVNLMASVAQAFDAKLPAHYPPVAIADVSVLQSVRKIVLIVIDGLGYNYLMSTDAESVLRQHLLGRLTSVFPATTASAIPTFLTGIAPQQHGLTGWFMYFRELGCVAAVLPSRPRYGGSSLRGAGVDLTALYGHEPVFNHLKTTSYMVMPQHIACSEFTIAHSGGATVRPYRSLQQFFRVIAGVVRQPEERSYIYAYWPEFDGLAHKHGVGSRQVREHFITLDKMFGEFLASIQSHDTAVIVTADHGIVDSPDEHLIRLDAHPVLAKTLALPLCGDRRMAYCYVRSGRQHEFERYVEYELQAYMTMMRSEDLIAQGYFGTGAVHPRLAERIGDYALILKQDFTLKDWLPGEREYVHIGAHGGVEHDEMYVPMILACP